MKKITGRYFRTTAVASILLVLPFMVGGQALAVNNLFDFFKRKQQPVAEQGQPQITKATQKTPTPPVDIKRVVSAPKSYNYQPDKLIEFDFSKIDFQKTASTVVNETPINLPLLPPYNVIVEKTTTLVEMPVSQRQDAKLLSAVHFVSEKDIGEVILKYYSHNPHFIWSSNGQLSQKSEQLMAYFAKSYEDGLNPSDYLVPLPANDLVGEEKDRAWAQFDVVLSARLLRYAQDAADGRIVADRLSHFHDLPHDRLDLNSAFDELTKAEHPANLLSSYLPQSNWYLALKLALADLREDSDVSTATIPANLLIHPGQSDNHLPDVVKLLLKKAPSSYLVQYRDVLKAHSNTSEYGPELKTAIQAFQKQSHKSADGIIGYSTITLLEGQNTKDKKQRVVESMERLRWLPRQLGNRYVLINQPSFLAQYFEDGQERLNMKVVVGSPSHQTYFFYDKIRLVTFNPSWGVPRSIMMNEMLPHIMKDPGYLSRSGYEVFNNSGKVISASSINWNKVASTGAGVGIRQKPGKNNALGELKILFPNKHDIYMHDTPNKSAFSRDMRALSHGCVRLENPRAMAAAVLGKDVKDLKPYFGKNERSVLLPEEVPVYLVYFTAWPNVETGDIDYFDDVYGRDKNLQTAMDKTTLSRNPAM